MENKEKIRSLAENVWAYIAAFLRWGVLGLLVGGLGGFVGALFAKSVAWATAMRGANPWLLYLLPSAVWPLWAFINFAAFPA